ncbi:MAG: hypothetical protein N2508_08130, partial [Anaerolineae bacterium]|nr:hypothetical protein [Anaerolineae bacterium]
VHITDRVPAGISVTALYGGNSRSAPVAGPGVLTWTVNVISNVPPANVVVVSYTARVNGAAASGNENGETVYLTNTVGLLYHSLTETVAGVRPYTGTDSFTVSTADANVRKYVSPPSSNTNHLRIGDIVTYTIVNAVPPGLVIPWPYQYDLLPVGFRYITGTFAVATNLPFVGSSLTDTLTPPFFSGGRTAAGTPTERGVVGLYATANPNVGPRYDNPSRQAVEWWLQPLDNSGRSITGWVTITFKVQVVGVDLQGNPVWPDQLASESVRNYVYLLWNARDRGAYTYTVPVYDDSSWVGSYVGQPHLRIDKHSVPPPGTYVGAGDRITYTLRITNSGRSPAYDIVIRDLLPAELFYVTSMVASNSPPYIAFLHQPPVGATGVLTWRVSELWGTDRNGGQPGVAMVTVVAQVTDTVGARRTFTNTAAIPYYDSQPGNGPGPFIPDEREYADGSDAVSHRTVNAGIAKRVTFGPPPTATLGTLVTYTLIVPARPISATLYNVVITDVVDSRMRIESVRTGGGTGWSWTWAGQVVTVTFASIPHRTQAYVTITVRISHEWPSPAGDANAGDVITDVAWMRHATAPVTTSNRVSTLVGEPRLLLDKSARSSSARLSDLDRTVLLTYTIRLTNTGTAPAYSVHITDRVPAGISVTALYGGNSRSAPVAGPGVLTWTVNAIGNLPPANVAVVSYTARISQALVNTWLTNTVGILYHSLTETVPGVRPYTSTDAAAVETAQPTVDKSTEPFILEVGDIVTYHVVFTVPAGTVWQGHTLVDGLNPGLWYITNSERLSWTPSTVNVTITNRVSSTTEVPGHQVIRWYFAPIVSELNIPTVVTLTFRAQAVGLRIDTLEPVWPGQTTRYWPGNYVQLEFPWPAVVTDVVTNMLLQPYLVIAKASTPPPGSYVGAGDRITYTLVVTNSGYGLAYDIVISDVLPAELFYVTSTVASNSPPYIAFLHQPPVGATGVLTWRINELWGLEWSPWGMPKVAVLTIVAQVTNTVGANLRFTNTAAIPYYDSQPGDGPGPFVPDEREYTDGSDSVWHQTVNATIRKSVTPLTVTLGETVTYVIVVPATPITATLYHVIVADRLDPRLQLHTVTDGPDGSVVMAGNAFTVTYPSIPAGQRRFITVTAVLSDPLGAVAGNVITNLAVLRHQDGGPMPSNQPPFTVTEPNLSMVKSSDPPTSSTVGAGQAVTYTVRITNASGAIVSPAYDIVLTDTLPIGMRDTAPVVIAVTISGIPVPAGAYHTSYHPSAGMFTIAFTAVFSIPAGSELVIRYRATVDSDVPAAIDLTNQAAVTWSSLPGPVPGDRNYGPITDTTTVHTGLPALEIGKSAWPSPVEAGAFLTYTIIVTNTGIVPATGVVVTDEVPVNTTYLSCSPSPCGASGGVVSWTLGVLDIGVPRILTMRVRVDTPLPNGTMITNTVWVTSTEGLTDTDTVTTPVTSAPVLRLAKSSTDANGAPLRPGDRLTYTLLVSNTGNEIATQVTVSDTVPAHTVYVAGSIAGGDSRSDAGLPVLVWVINSLAPGEAATLS